MKQILAAGGETQEAWDYATHDAAFLPVIWTYVRQYNGSDGLTRKKLWEGTLDGLKKWADVPPKMVSREVIRLMQGRESSPFSLLWPDRFELGHCERIGRKRSMLLWEHTTPLNEAARSLVKCADELQVKEWMSAYSGVCWITRAEDDMLNDKGFRSRRPGGWERCYAECGIDVVSRAEYLKLKTA